MSKSEYVRLVNLLSEHIRSQAGKEYAKYCKTRKIPVEFILAAANGTLHTKPFSVVAELAYKTNYPSVEISKIKNAWYHSIENASMYNKNTINDRSNN